MASTVLKILVSLIVLLSSYGGQVDCKVDRYAFKIVENGARVNEEIEVDVGNQTEVIRVPQHNNVDAVEVMNDFVAGLSVRRVPSTKDCYVSELDSSFPSPEKMKRDMDQASRQSLPDKATTKRASLRVLGFADRLALPQKILDFCGNFPIYDVELTPLDSRHESLSPTQSQGRRKRSHWISNFNGCSHADNKTMNYCLNTVGPFNIKLSCKYDRVYCYYIAQCVHKVKTHMYIPTYYCKQIVHHFNYVGICCSPRC